jgi:hypothetical protein
MNTGNMQFDIGHMVRILRTRQQGGQRTVLVLGSRVSNLFHSNEFYETMKLFADPSFANLPHMERFAECYRLLVRTKPGFSVTDIDTILTQSLKHAHFTDADVCLAELVKSRIFDIILTSTMDNALEQALEFVGLRELHEFEVFSLHPGSVGEELRFGNNVHCHIIKVFGELTSRDYTMKRAGCLTQNQSIRQYLERVASRDVLIIGLDPVWDAEIYQICSTGGGSLWFINEEQLDEDSNLFHAGEARNAGYLWGDACEYHQFIPELYERYFGMAPDELLVNDWTGTVSILRVLHRLTYEVKKLREEVLYHRESL